MGRLKNSLSPKCLYQSGYAATLATVTILYETRVKVVLRVKAMGGLKNSLSPACLYQSGYAATLATVTAVYETRVKVVLRAKAMGRLKNSLSPKCVLEWLRGYFGYGDCCI